MMTALFIIQPSSFEYQLIEFHQPLAAANQLRCNNRSSREAFAAAGAMGDLDQVVGRVEEERVQAELAPDARRRDRRVELPGASALDFVRDANRRAARRVLLLRVVPLFHAGGVLRKPREQL